MHRLHTKRNGNRQVRRRKRLFKQHPYCCYCNCLLINTVNDPNSVTLEHFISRNNPLRGKIQGTTALACKKCNNEKAAVEEQALPIEELWSRSRHINENKTTN